VQVVAPVATPLVEPVQEESKVKKAFKAIGIIILSLMIVGLAIVIVPMVTSMVAENVINNNTPTETTTKSAAQIEREEFQDAKNRAIEQIKSSLRDPGSMEVHDVYWKNTPPSESSSEYVDMDCKFVIKIDFSARNGFGGMNRATAYALCYDSGYVKVSYDGEGMTYLSYQLTYLAYSYIEK
ncbi:MAG: hypothetical protein IKU41_05185, partial [Clostridia bacterium]|nr:hypothetical protein [Clostridia bacterium]